MRWEHVTHCVCVRTLMTYKWPPPQTGKDMLSHFGHTLEKGWHRLTYETLPNLYQLCEQPRNICSEAARRLCRSKFCMWLLRYRHRLSVTYLCPPTLVKIQSPVFCTRTTSHLMPYLGRPTYIAWFVEWWNSDIRDCMFSGSPIKAERQSVQATSPSPHYCQKVSLQCLADINTWLIQVHKYRNKKLMFHYYRHCYSLNCCCVWRPWKTPSPFLTLSKLATRRKLLTRSNAAQPLVHSSVLYFKFETALKTPFTNFDFWNVAEKPCRGLLGRPNSFWITSRNVENRLKSMKMIEIENQMHFLAQLF